MNKAIFYLLTILIVSSCAAEVKAPSVRVGTRPVIIDYDNGGDFCPPGQAKKGRC